MKVIGDLRPLPRIPSHPDPDPGPGPPCSSISYDSHITRSLDRDQLPLRQLHLKRALLPDDDDLALVRPVLLTGHELIVEAEQEPRDGDAQLRVGQVLAQAVPRSEAEGVCCKWVSNVLNRKDSGGSGKQDGLLLTEGRLVVVGEGRVVQLMRGREPSLGAHGVWVVEVVGVAVGCVLEDCGEGL